MTPASTITVIVLFVATDVLIVGTLLGAAKRTLDELHARFPERAPRPNAIAREFQSFRFDLLNLGWCVHVLVDEDNLHLRPAWFARMFCRMHAMSIPWEAIEIDPKATRSRRMLSARVAGVDVVGPTWCLNLARPEPAEMGVTTDKTQ